MRRTRALKNAGGLMAAGSLDMLAVRLFAAVDTPERWSKLLARQADAYAHGEGMCIYDPLSFLHYPSIHAFVVGPVMAYSTIALLVVGLAVSAFAVRMERRTNQQQLADAEDEVNG
jgi:hypothetical protein